MVPSFARRRLDGPDADESRLDGGYIIGYVPSHADDGRYHTVKVRALRHYADVRTRGGYVSAPSIEMRRALRASGVGPMRMLRRSPFVDVWSG